MPKKKTVHRSSIAIEASAEMSHGEFESIITRQIAVMPDEAIRAAITSSSKDALLNALWYLEGRLVFSLGMVPLFVRYAPTEKQYELREKIRSKIYRLEYIRMLDDCGDEPF